MKRFNKTIMVEMEVDVIAQQLRSMFKEDSAHADTVVEQIIGRAEHQDKALIGRIVGAMNGFKRDLIAEVGVTYPCKDLTAWGYWTEESRLNGNTVRQSVDSAKVIAIDEFSDTPLQISFPCPDSKGVLKDVTMWIPAEKLTV